MKKLNRKPPSSTLTKSQEQIKTKTVLSQNNTPIVTPNNSNGSSTLISTMKM